MTTPLRLLFVLVLAATFAGCSESGLIREARPNTLTGTVWRVVSINGQPPVAGSEPTISFAASEVKGSAGCNSYSGGYAYDPSTGSISFAQMAMTAMACVEDRRNQVEAAFTKALGSAASASMDPQGRLILSGPGGEILLTVDAVPA